MSPPANRTMSARSAAATLVRTQLMDVETFARATGLHPELVRRLVSLGVLDATRDAAGELRLPPAQLAAAARIQRLRAAFSLNYAALGLVMDLLDRIDVLERALRNSTRTGGRSWTSTA